MNKDCENTLYPEKRQWVFSISLTSVKIYLPYIFAYKPTTFGSIITFKLWGSDYTWVMPHSQS